MKIYLLILIGLVTIILSCEDMNSGKGLKKEKDSVTQFYDRILDDYGTQSYYLYLEVGAEIENTFPIIIQNDNLAYLFRHEGHYSRMKYKEKIKDVLNSESKLIVDPIMVQKLKKYKIDTTSCGQIPKDYQMIKEKYFDRDMVIKRKFVANKYLQNCIIYLLFKNGIIIRNQDESGFLKLEN